MGEAVLALERGAVDGREFRSVSTRLRDERFVGTIPSQGLCAMCVGWLLRPT